MAELETKEHDGSVDEFLDAVDNTRRREDAREVAALMGEITGEPARMWGKSLIGFGRYQYKYASGREGEWFVAGLSPRKASLVVYVMPGFSAYDDLLGRLGKHKTGKSCLYIRKLDDVDRGVLRELIEASVAHMREKYPAS